MTDHFAQAVVAWLWLTVWPFSVLGVALAYFGQKYEGIYTPAAKRILVGLAVAVALAGIAAVPVSAAAVYSECNNPAYADSWWWYAWGCWMN